MINRFVKKIFREKPSFSKKTLLEVKETILEIRKRHSVLAICPNNTGANWAGIKQGTISLFPENYLLLDQYYSNSAYSQNELKNIAKFLADSRFEKIVFRGFPPYFTLLIKEIKDISNVPIFVMYAGPASEFNEEKKTSHLTQIVQLAKDGLIHKIGFNKVGLAEAIQEIYGVPCGRYILKGPQIPIANQHKTAPTSMVKIGVLGGNTFNKNIHTQVLAALTVNATEIHVLNKPDFGYLPNQNRIVGYGGHLNHYQFLDVVSNMDVNLYLAFSESWGNVITESLAFGVPCLSNNCSGIFDYDSYLKEVLVVEDYDNIVAIKHKISAVLDDYQEVSSKCMQYIPVLNSHAEHLLNDFLK